MKATIVVDPMFGDGGKGAAVDYLSQDADLIVRFNGGAQASHTIQANGKRIETGLFGSGILNKVPVFLSRHVRVDPIAIEVELEEIHNQVESIRYDQITIDPRALIVTPYHVEASQKAAGISLKGTTGMGIGESGRNEFAYPETAIYARDLLYRSVLLQKLWGQSWDYRSKISVEETAEHLSSIGAYLRICEWEKMPHRGKKYVFEGSGGFYLDPVEGFKPHVTSTRTTQINAVPLILGIGALEEVSYNTVGVLPILTTRHGSGDFPTEEPRLKRFFPTDLPENNPGQGPQRVGWLDLDLAANACRKMYVDELHVTHLDYWDRIPFWKVKWNEMVGEVKSIDQMIAMIEESTNIPVTVTANGPDRKDRHERKRV